MKRLIKPRLKDYAYGNILGYIIYYYSDGHFEIRPVVQNMARHYGMKHNGTRPILAEVVGDIPDTFKQKYLKFLLHPFKGRII